MIPIDLHKWAQALRLAADQLDGCVIPGGVLYEAARREVKRVDDEMYVAHQERAAAAWDQVRERRAAS